MGKRRATDVAPRLWVEEGQARVAPLITVALLKPIDTLYTYTASQEMAEHIKPGQRLIVPTGRRNRPTRAIVVKVDQGPWSSTLKAVESILDPAGALDDHLMELGTWIHRYYCCPLGRALAAMLPQAARKQSGFVTVRRASLVPSFAATDDRLRLGTRQRKIIDVLAGCNEPINVTDLLERSGASRSSLLNLIHKGIVVETVEKQAPRESPTTDVPLDPDHDLTEDQHRAVQRIGRACNQGGFGVQVLHGVSGSGKTEVYVRAIRHVVAAGGQAILLVPEIALTTQLVQRLARRFADVAVIHSGLTGSQRSLAWEAIRTGAKKVVIGTRSAVFAPCPKLALIVVDEEQETSYKNLQAPRFHVRDVAIKRAQMLGIPIVLGSATPSLETWYNLKRLDAYQRIELPRRVCERPMPDVQIVDMCEAMSPQGGMPTMSQPLIDALSQTLERGEQAIVLLNRRGYAAWLQCMSCGTRIGCPNCRTSLVLHHAQKQVRCHYCHLRVNVPPCCPDPSCRGKLARGGQGSERLEDVLSRVLPAARIRRADSDTMKHGDDYRKLIDDFEHRRFDVMIGTQMIAKGLDFANVTLVGVIGAEPVSAGSDFRAAERLHQLVSQVAGRAGRADAPGRVIVQSLNPQIPALRFAADHDFTAFAEAELKRRLQYRLPPAVRMARLVISAKRDRQAADQTAELVGRLRELAQSPEARGVDVLGPTPCAIERIRNLYRHEALVCAPTATALMHVLDVARQQRMLTVKQATLMIDVDPIALT